jgi:hypothetical protein
VTGKAGKEKQVGEKLGQERLRDRESFLAPASPAITFFLLSDFPAFPVLLVFLMLLVFPDT